MSQPLLTLDNLHLTFEKGTVNENPVLRGIDLAIHKGDFITIIGGNGAGKSTLLNTIAGSLRPDEGQIHLHGENITKQNVVKRAAKISRVFQDPKMGTAVRLTVEENLSIALKRGRKRTLSRGVKKQQRDFLKEKLATLQLGLEERLQTEIGLLSGGQRQAITLLMATIIQPDLLLLDEHTAALDPQTSKTVMTLTEQLIHEQDLTAFMITHNMNDAIRYGNRLIMLHQGKIVVDVSGREKSDLTVPQLLQLFEERSGEALTDDSLLLT
ncbi:ABC transporter ATP-binding protein [Vagococcus lutrae]|uniref:ABC transporter ATP-binding protein n=1 Tax=Vagococcus lutrae TaxID=81947 RepID=UPI00200DA6DA|nr:ATP-binding cassette domain-containing protein [Vagococcus lutrae]MDT2841813.1 ATP-binding cassette domain-containing protein [Vagococcus lutrae]UQF22580.1 ATP-binding cassette domain-containing protein [Vagococcus lutrae]UQF63501.1 ATP-binding cassette domain-containing protein [Vagococcus lutrae]